MKDLRQDHIEPQVSNIGSRNLERLEKLTKGRNASGTPMSSIGGYSASSSSKRPGSTSAYGGSNTRGTLTSLSSNHGFK